MNRANLTDQWYNIVNKEGNMTNYQVHFEYIATPSGTGWVRRGQRTVQARNEKDAITIARRMVEGSFGHWVNRLANEEAI